VAGVLVGEGDINAQIDQVVANAMITLDAVVADPSDVVRTVIYVVSDDTSDCYEAKSVLRADLPRSVRPTASLWQYRARLVRVLLRQEEHAWFQ